MVDISRRGFLGGVAALAVAPVKVLAEVTAEIPAELPELAPDGLWMGLSSKRFYEIPHDADFAELQGNGYQRMACDADIQACPFEATVTSVEFPAATDDWAPVHSWALFDAPRDGNMLIIGAFNEPFGAGRRIREHERLHLDITLDKVRRYA